MSNEPPPLPPAPPEVDPHAPLEPHVAELVALAELMLGAAYADGKATWPERSALASVLSGFFGHKDLPPVVSARIQTFDPKTFDVEATVKRVTVRTAEDRTQLLGLLSRVTDADARLNRGEEDYLRKVAALIGATADELAPFIAAD
ncbi:MAG: TerB family tellurite resistance protein [Myxococcota bacterium]